MTTIHLLLFATPSDIPPFREATKSLQADVQIITTPSQLAVIGQTWSTTDHAVLIMDTRSVTKELFTIIVDQRARIRCRVDMVFYGESSASYVIEARQTNVATVIPQSDIREVVREITAQFGIPSIDTHTEILAVGSAKGGVGKSLLVCRLAEALAMMGSRVLLVDMDVSNPSLVKDLHIPEGLVVPFLLQRQAAHANKITPDVLRQSVYTVTIHQSHPWSFDLLSATVRQSSTKPVRIQDISWMEWEELHGMLKNMRTRDGQPYDVVMIDTGPDIFRRPYPIDVVRRGGYLVIPTTGRPQDIEGLNSIFSAFQTIQQEQPYIAPFQRVFIAPSFSPKGSVHHPNLVIDSVKQAMGEQWVSTHVLMPIPRDDYLISVCERMNTYASPLLVGPGTRFTESMIANARYLAQQCRIATPLPPPTIPWYTRILRLFGKRFGMNSSYLDAMSDQHRPATHVSNVS
jgi:cellulose biosynthesis protein BcsQ